MTIRRTVDVGRAYSPRLATRDEAKKFKDKYLSVFYDKHSWEDPECKVVLDFTNVKKISPGFADTAFGEFTYDAKNIEELLEHIVIQNASTVQLAIIKGELFRK